jgi:hypothetical protein
LITVNANEYSIDSKTLTVKPLEIDSRYYVSLRNGCVLWLEKIIKSDNKNVSTFLRGQIAQ